MSDVFISYSPEDHEVAQALASKLRGMGLGVTLDDRVLVGGLEFSAAVVEQIQQAPAVVVLLSANTRRSSWVPKELTTALLEDKSRPVFALLLDDEAKNNWVWPVVAQCQRIDMEREPRDLDAAAVKVHTGIAFGKLMSKKRWRPMREFVRWSE